MAILENVLTSFSFSSAVCSPICIFLSISLYSRMLPSILFWKKLSAPSSRMSRKWEKESNRYPVTSNFFDRASLERVLSLRIHFLLTNTITGITTRVKRPVYTLNLQIIMMLTVAVVTAFTKGSMFWLISLTKARASSLTILTRSAYSYLLNSSIFNLKIFPHIMFLTETTR